MVFARLGALREFTSAGRCVGMEVGTQAAAATGVCVPVGKLFGLSYAGRVSVREAVCRVTPLL